MVELDDSDNKRHNELFDRGPNPIHTFICILYPLLCFLLPTYLSNVSKRFQDAIECLTIIPLIIGLTVFAPYIYQLTFVLFLINVVLLIVNCHKVKLLDVLNSKNVPRKELFIISFLRGLTYLVTSFCILAVKFHIFPPYLAKSYCGGFSLMDVGVGVFILMSGLVHKELKNIFFGSNAKLIFLMLAYVLLFNPISNSIAPNILPDQEYGVHWNFYYTLAVTKTLPPLILYCIGNKKALAMSILLAFIHQVILLNGVQTWVISKGPRDNFLNANREGISSCLGFVSLYLFGVYLKVKLQDNNIVRKNLLYVLFSLSIFTWLAVYVVNWAIPISRVLCNITYCFYIEALVVSVILILYLFEILLHEKDIKLPNIFLIIRHNGFIHYLLSSLITRMIHNELMTYFCGVYLTLLLMYSYSVGMLVLTYLYWW